MGKLGVITPRCAIGPLNFAQAVPSDWLGAPVHICACMCPWEQERKGKERQLQENPEVHLATPDPLYFQDYVVYLKHNPNVVAICVRQRCRRDGVWRPLCLSQRDLAVSFSLCREQQWVQEGKFSSAEREVQDASLLVQTGIRQDAGKLPGSRLYMFA